MSLNRLTRLKHRLEAQGRAILDLTGTNPTQADLSLPGDFVLQAVADPSLLKYRPDPQGAAEARRAVARYYADRGWIVEPEQILLTASTSEAYACIFKLLADPGERILTPRPSYPLLGHLLALEGLGSQTYRLHWAAGWTLDTQELAAKLLDPQVKALALVHPNNPTGSLVSKRQWDAIGTVCSRAFKPIIVDEVFYDYRLTPGGDLRINQTSPVLTFVLNGLSKTAAFPQVKASWILLAGPTKEVRAAKERLEFILDTYLSVSTMAQQVLPAALQHRRLRQDPVKARIAENLALLRTALRDSAASLLDCEGGWSAVIKLPRLCSEQEWAKALLQSQSVWAHPGRFYSFEHEPFIVVSLLTPPAVMSPALDRLRNLVRSLAERPLQH